MTEPTELDITAVISLRELRDLAEQQQDLINLLADGYQSQQTAIHALFDRVVALEANDHE